MDDWWLDCGFPAMCLNVVAKPRLQRFPEIFCTIKRHPFQGVYYLMRPIVDAESISNAVVFADFYFVIASGSSSPVRGPGTMLPR